MVTKHGPRKARGIEDPVREARDEPGHGLFNQKRRDCLKRLIVRIPQQFVEVDRSAHRIVVRSVAAPEVRLASVLPVCVGLMDALPYFNVQPPGGTP